MIRRRNRDRVAQEESDERTDEVLSRLELAVERLEVLVSQRQDEPPPKPR